VSTSDTMHGEYGEKRKDREINHGL
jgi:hypothetical protein